MEKTQESRAACPVAVAMLLTLLLITSSSARASTLPPPAYSQDLEAHSARNYATLEREFVKHYLFDGVYGGTYLTADGKGNVLDSSKNIIFQANIILFLAGMDSQSPDPEISRYVDSAAGFIVKYLKWGAHANDVPGTWHLSSDRDGGAPQDMTWIAPSEAYISHGLLWAYKITGNSAYLDVVRTNLAYQMQNFPDGHILDDARPGAGDVTYRSPERMAYYTMWQMMGDATYLDYAHRVQGASSGTTGRDPAGYLHGNVILDEIEYALSSGDETALSEGRQLVEQFWAQVGLGGSRDDYQMLLADDLALWTITKDTKYRDDSITAYEHIVGFWDPTPPYGFWSLIGQTKTCFSRGYPLFDMTPPAIEADPEGQKITAKIVDPDFQWLSLTYTGIGVNPKSVRLFYSLDGKAWTGDLEMTATGGDIFTTLVPQEVAQQNLIYLISASDYFNNTSTVEFAKQATPVTTTTTPATTTTTPVAPPTGSSGMGFAFAAIAAGIGGAAIAVGLGLGLTYTPSAAKPSVTCYPIRSCPYWDECVRRHHATYPSCAVRCHGTASGCCICYSIGAARRPFVR